ncbi:MAG: hypothetical protein VB083_02930 [Aminobacterium sp.]|uniref:hypothetical protein n=1 Tax=Aminobacterium sp. TaxID=1872491 RepID=UPI001BCBFE6A|nr:hypothetical protein [Aminobacterium sp.]MEA4876842.1 hypothetical protein [Aminobacterium sp.]
MGTFFRKHEALIVIVGVLVVMAATAFLIWTFPFGSSPSVGIEAQKTDTMTSDLFKKIEDLSGKLKAIDSKVRREEKDLYEKTKRAIRSLPPDAVADGLNDELNLFRGLETCSSRMGHP